MNHVWLADNIDVFDDTMLVCPAFDTSSVHNIDTIGRQSPIATAIVLAARVATAILNLKPISEAFRDPEISLLFSNTFVSPTDPSDPIRLIFFDETNVVHFEIDLVETRANNPPRRITGGQRGFRQFFNEQVTHAAHLRDKTGGYITCINFEQPRVLLLDDRIFKEKIAHQLAG